MILTMPADSPSLPDPPCPRLPAWLAPRNTKVGPRHAVASGHYLASAAAYAILEAGGNAVDAGCAPGSRSPSCTPTRSTSAASRRS